ncbi:MAG: hypothetical protein ISQ65_02350 [Pseudomonadales bacterium]|nr:hypothetical protein [Pseudomonadales bacterium]
MSIDYPEALNCHLETVLADERAYTNVWLREVAPLTSRQAQAVRGGLLADRLAWVFVAGYQCALRHTFAQLPAESMAAFAVSEDRKGEPVLPGVTATVLNGETKVSGYKTWVACCATLSHLVIKSDRGDKANYYCLERSSHGLTLTPRYGSFLAEMSQGVAELNEVAVASPLDTSEVSHFGLRETLYIYMAFCAWAGKFVESADRCQALISRLAGLTERLPLDEAALAELKAVDQAVQVLRGSIPATAAANYEQDQRLIAMYSPGIQKRELN